MMTLRFAARWPLWSIFTSFQCLALVQTDWQRQLLHQVNHTAHWMSKEFGPQLLDRLDRADVRGLLAQMLQGGGSVTRRSSGFGAEKGSDGCRGRVRF